MPLTALEAISLEFLETHQRVRFHRPVARKPGRNRLLALTGCWANLPLVLDCVFKAGTGKTATALSLSSNCRCLFPHPWLCPGTWAFLPLLHRHRIVCGAPESSACVSVRRCGWPRPAAVLIPGCSKKKRCPELHKQVVHISNSSCSTHSEAWSLTSLANCFFPALKSSGLLWTEMFRRRTLW